MTYEYILTEVHDRAGLVRLNRPQVLNALNGDLLRELMDALTAFDRDEAIGAMVIAGGEKAFAAGADIKQMAGASPVEMLNSEFIEQFDRILTIRKPVIAAVSGYALGGGCELALGCDMIVASETAQFGQPEIDIGVIPGAGGTQRLTRAVGKALAMEMVLTGRRLNAEDAHRLGLVNHIASVDKYLEIALDLANAVAARPPVAVRVAKEMVNVAFETTLAEGLASERRSFFFLFSTEDQKEGMAAFIGKRKPEWKGR